MANCMCEMFLRLRALFLRFLFTSSFAKRYILPVGVRVLWLLSYRVPLKAQSAKLVPEDVISRDMIEDCIRFRDMLLGVAIGDAYGAGVELLSRDWICSNVDFKRYYNQRAFYGSLLHAVNYATGLYTDDTEMTLGLVKALIKFQNGLLPTEHELIRFWKEEFNRNCNWLGVCRQGHGSIKNYFLGFSSLEEVQLSQSKKQYPGNAPTMRAVPLGLLKPHDLITLAIANANATHPHVKARASSLAIAWASNFIIVQQGHLKSVIRYVVERFKELPQSYDSYDDEFLDGLVKVDELPSYHDLGHGPYGAPPALDYALLCGPTLSLGADAMRTTYCVLYFLKFFKDPFDLLKVCIRLGGDVDSVASVALGIAGGRFGLDFGEASKGGIPMWMLDSLEGVDYIQDLAKKLSNWYSFYKK